MNPPFEYQRSGRYFAQIASNLEEIGASELEKLGATETRADHRGIRFKADPKTLYRINYSASLITRVLAPLAGFACRTPEELYDRSRAIPWESLFEVDRTFAIFANVTHSEIRHSNFAALKLKDAIVDRFRAKKNRRPSIDKDRPDIWINLHLERNEATLSVDTSGGSLHRRGYRRKTVQAPIQETLAAAILALAEWNGERPLRDPMCGSGTFLAEGLLKAGKIPTGRLRETFGFERLPDFEPRTWAQVRDAADSEIRAIPEGLIAGSDESPIAVKAARQNLNQIPFGNEIRVTRERLQDRDPFVDSVLVFNPPYGIRLGETEQLEGFYGELGDFLKQRCQGCTAYVYFGNREFLKRIGLRPSWKRPLFNAGLDGRLAKFELY